MNHSAGVTLLICSLAVVCIAGFLPFLSSDLHKKHRTKFPVWSMGLAAIALLSSLASLSRLRLSPPQITDDLALATAMLTGLGLKWCLECLAQKKFSVHEGALFRALLVAPLALAAFPGIFGARATPAAMLLWFLNGFFWQAIFSDIERLMTKERIVIRRREPPTLPHDFRKPETG